MQLGFANVERKQVQTPTEKGLLLTDAQDTHVVPRPAGDECNKDDETPRSSRTETDSPVSSMNHGAQPEVSSEFSSRNGGGGRDQ